MKIIGRRGKKERKKLERKKEQSERKECIHKFNDSFFVCVFFSMRMHVDTFWLKCYQPCTNHETHHLSVSSSILSLSLSLCFYFLPASFSLSFFLLFNTSLHILVVCVGGLRSGMDVSKKRANERIKGGEREENLSNQLVQEFVSIDSLLPKKEKEREDF